MPTDSPLLSSYTIGLGLAGRANLSQRTQLILDASRHDSRLDGPMGRIEDVIVWYVSSLRARWKFNRFLKALDLWRWSWTLCPFNVLRSEKVVISRRRGPKIVRRRQNFVIWPRDFQLMRVWNRSLSCHLCCGMHLQFLDARENFQLLSLYATDCLCNTRASLPWAVSTAKLELAPCPFTISA